MQMTNRRAGAPQAQELIAVAQKLARDSERHAILSESLAKQADRVMAAGLRLLAAEPIAGSQTVRRRPAR